MNKNKIFFKFIIFTVIVLLLQNCSVFAAIDNNKIQHLNAPKVSVVDEPKTDKPDLTTTGKETYAGPSFFNLISSLAIVIMLILITGWIYSKLSRINAENLFSGKLSQLKDNTFKIISTVQLGPNKTLHLIEINNKQLIIGCTQDKINLITEMNKDADNTGSIEKLLSENPSLTIENAEKTEKPSVSDIGETENIYKKYL
jgi:flagellar biogenesis protein FliO